MWNDMFIAGVSYGEKAARTIIVYLALLIMLRIVGKRGLAQLNTFDLVVMLLLSNVVQNAVIGNDNSVSGGVFGAAVLLLTDAVLVRQGARRPWFARLLEGTPTVLAQDGVLNIPAMRRQGISRGDVALAVHTQGGDSIGETELVQLEPSGAVLVRLREGDQFADKADVAALRALLERIEARLPTER
ncbi:DUF421 domain-containing protein [Streptacidiphilus pinicola]|uniref:DUF421 domain-containing protein n=1 Tax=Streptacidiphilus pinicola TaxID=2219663 RepID=A0A2X0IU67_9ACTN|nr:YetF domain-containing protein [Streptacidiphilus pinicola]RAG87173.1 DUF421 domain-containing protein [Streptacidiphilus pinicola]